MITVTDKAKEKLLALRTEGQHPEHAFVRVGVAGGGCSGLTYVLDFDTNEKPDDKIFEDKGIRIVCDKKSFLYLIGNIISDFLYVAIDPRIDFEARQT